MHGGQRGQHEVAAPQVVEADDGHALRHGHLHPVGGEQGALGQVVVAEEDGVDGRRLAHDLAEHQAAQGHGRGRRVHPLQGRVEQAFGLHHRAPAGLALQGAWVHLDGGKGDAALAPGDQVAGQVGARIALREAHAVDAFVRAVFHQVHAGHATARHERLGGLGVVEAGDQQAGRAVHQLLAQQLLFFAGVVVGHADQRLVAGAAHAGLHGFQQGDEQLVRQHGNQHRHVRAAVRGQCARRRVGHISQLGGGRLHPFHQFGGDGPFPAQGARHRDRADPGGQRDVGKGDAAGGALADGRGGHGVRVSTRYKMTEHL